jgi:hypothetical protein
MYIGDIIEVLFVIKNTRINQYFRGMVLRVSENDFSIKYDDGLIETHPKNTVWRYSL